MEVAFALSPILLVVLGASSLAVVRFWEWSRSHGSSTDQSSLCRVGALVFGWAAVLSLVVGHATQRTSRLEVLAPYYEADSFSAACSFLICLSAAACLLFGEGSKESTKDRAALVLLLSLTTVGALALTGATDLLTIIVCTPLLTVGIGGLCGLSAESSRSREAAIKYWLLNGFGSALFLFGAGALYGATGQTSLQGMGSAVSSGMLAGGALGAPLLVVGVVGVLVGLAVRVGAVPFHMWLPDVNDGVPVEVAAFLTSAVKVAAFSVLSRVLLVALDGTRLAAWGAGWPPVLATVAVCTSLLGALVAARQERIQRMLGYLSIAHSGGLLAGMVALKGRSEMLSFVSFYLLAHVPSLLGAYACLVGCEAKGASTTRYVDLEGLGRRWPLWGVGFALLVLSLAGIPPTVGFWGRAVLWSSLVKQGYFALAAASLVAELVVTACCCRLVVCLFAGGERRSRPESANGPPRRVRIATGALAVGVLYVGLFPPL